MEIDKTTTEHITWDIELCAAEAKIITNNGKITDKAILINKITDDSVDNVFKATDYQFMKDVYKALGEYLQHYDSLMKGVNIEVITVEPTQPGESDNNNLNYHEQINKNDTSRA